MDINKVLLVSIDTLRYDCLGFVKSVKNEKTPHLAKYGLQNEINTPVINEIASKSSYFTNCFSTSSYTPPAHASLFTGLYPPNHGVRPFFYKKLRNDCVTLAKVFKNNGYKTIFSMDMDIFSPLGLTRGFDYIVTGNDTELADLLERFKGEKVFLFIHVFDVHDPYVYSETPPAAEYNDDYFDLIKEMSRKFNITIEEKEPHKIWKELAGKVKNDIKDYFPLYVKGVNKFDGGRFKLIHQVLKNFGFFDFESIYSILSDHGEGRVSYGDQSGFSHAGELYDEIIHIPLIFHAPQLEDKIRDGMVSIIDIYPSVISYAGLDFPGGYRIDGRKIEHESDCKPDEFNCKPDAYAANSREFCYSEYFANKIIGNKNENAAANNGGVILNKFSAGDEYFLFQRSVRTKSKKFMYLGKFLTEYKSAYDLNKLSANFGVSGVSGLSNLSDEDYVKSLYKIVLNRFEDEGGYSAHLSRLKSKETSRLDLMKEFIESTEYKQRLKMYYYDLIADPLEENPVSFGINGTAAAEDEAAEDEAAAKEGMGYINILNGLEKNAVITDDIFADADEALLVAKNNGYGYRNDKTATDLLDSKVSFSIDIIREAYDRFACSDNGDNGDNDDNGGNADNIGIAFTGGKDSTVMLDLVRRAFGGAVPFKVVNIDTTVDFPEIYKFIDKLKQEWGFDLKVYSNKEAAKSVNIAQDKKECCSLLKTVPLKNAITDLNLKALMTAIRKDEQEYRQKESYFSKRHDPEHFRVHPILHFTEADIWNYIKFYNIPYCSLYEQGYRSLGCIPCTVKSRPGEPERAGRSQEKELIMDKLRDLGYF